MIKNWCYFKSFVLSMLFVFFSFPAEGLAGLLQQFHSWKEKMGMTVHQTTVHHDDGDESESDTEEFVDEDPESEEEEEEEESIVKQARKLLKSPSSARASKKRGRKPEAAPASRKRGKPVAPETETMVAPAAGAGHGRKHAKTKDSTTIPSPEAAKKSPRAAVAAPAPSSPSKEEEIDLTFDIRREALLRQNNGWECGYYAIFHYIASKQKLLKNPDYNTPKQLRTRYNEFIAQLNPLLAAYAAKLNAKNQADLLEEFNGSLDIAARHKSGEMLGDWKIHYILQAIKEDNDVAVISRNMMQSVIPTEPFGFNRLHNLVSSGRPFWLITGDQIHWACLKFEPGQDCIVYDSLGASSLSWPIVQRLAAIAWKQIQLPSVDTFTRIRKAIIRAKNQAQINAIRADALANGFTEETIEALLNGKSFASDEEGESIDD